MKYKYLLIALCVLTMTVRAQEQTNIVKIEPVPNQDISYDGNLSNGVLVKDLSWAWSSQNACFPETQKSKFTGNHVFYTGVIPKYSEITATVIPKDKNANFSMYSYMLGEGNIKIVPDLPSCIRCEADHKQERNRVGKSPQNHTRTISNLIAINRPYQFIIGVTGADSLNEGEFTLVISTKTR